MSKGLACSGICMAAKRAESYLKIKIPFCILAEVLRYSKRKCEVIKKPPEYLPLLFETELIDYFCRKEINERSAKNYA